MPEAALPHEQSEGSGGAPRRLILFGAAVLALLILSYLYKDTARTYLEDFLRWTRGLGLWAYLVVGVVYVVAVVAFIPGSILTIGSGAVFGWLGGFILVSLASTTGAALAFLVGRYLARGSVARMIEGNRKFEAIDSAVGRQGFKIVFLTRLSPIFPFNLQNYAYGLTQVRFWPYTLASWVGMIPGTLVYVGVGAAAGSLAKAAADAGRDPGTGRIVLLIVGLLATIAVTYYITQIARRALRDAVEAEKDPRGDPAVPSD